MSRAERPPTGLAKGVSPSRSRAVGISTLSIPYHWARLCRPSYYFRVLQKISPPPSKKWQEIMRWDWSDPIPTLFSRPGSQWPWTICKPEGPQEDGGWEAMLKRDSMGNKIMQYSFSELKGGLKGIAFLHEMPPTSWLSVNRTISPSLKKNIFWEGGGGEVI